MPEPTTPAESVAADPARNALGQSDLTPAPSSTNPNPSPTPSDPAQAAQAASDATQTQGGQGEPEPQTLRDAIEAQTDPTAALRAEAAGRRRQLREVEAERDVIRDERDGLLARIDFADRREAERLVAERLHDPADFWANIELAELRDDNGDLDPARVSEAVAVLTREKPHYRKPVQLPPFDGGAAPPALSGPSIGEALRRAARGGS